MNKDLRPSLGSQTLVNPCFLGLTLTGVATGKLPKELGPWVEVIQRKLTCFCSGKEDFMSIFLPLYT